MSSRFISLLAVRRCRYFLPLLLALLLLVAQTGAHVHLVGHVGEALHSGVSAHGEAHGGGHGRSLDDPAEHAADAGCLICLAFAGIDLPPLAAGGAVSLQAAPAVLFSAAACRAGSDATLRPRCRAPPVPPILFPSFA